MTSSDDFHLLSWQNILLLVGVVIAALVPVVFRRLSGRGRVETSV